MDNDHVAAQLARISQAIFESFDLTYDAQSIRSMLLEAIGGQVGEDEKVDSEAVAIATASELAGLIHSHLNRTVWMSVCVLLAVAHKIVLASILKRRQRPTDKFREFLPSDDELRQTIEPVLAWWLEGFDVPLRLGGRLPKTITPDQFKSERTEWLQNARAEYAALKNKDKGNLGLALGYGRGKDGKQSKESAGTTLRRRMTMYGYEWEDITGKK